ncbi:DNA-directed DNA polymerase [Tanacetum coccineum]
MAETMEHNMSKTRTDYGSELRENTFSGVENEDANEHIEKVLEIVDLFHVPNITEDQLMLRVFPISLTGSASCWLRNKLTGSIKTWEDLKAKFLNKGAIPTKTAEDAKNVIQEMAEYSQKWHNGTSRGRSTDTSDGLAAIQAQLNNLGREIKKVNEKVYAAQVGCEQCKGSRYTKDCPLKEERKTLEEAYYTQFGGPFQGGGYRATALGYYRKEDLEAYQAQLKQTREIKSSRFLPLLKCIHTRYAVLDLPNTPYPMDRTKKKRGSMDQNSQRLMELHISITPYPERKKDPESFTLPYFINNVCFDNAHVDLGASVSVMPLLTYLNLGLGGLAHTRLTVELAYRTVKYPKGIAENVLVGIGKFTFPVDFIILDMPEDIKVPLILKRPFLSTARSKIDVYKRKITLRVREENIIFT